MLTINITLEPAESVGSTEEPAALLLSIVYTVPEPVRRPPQVVGTHGADGADQEHSGQVAVAHH